MLTSKKKIGLTFAKGEIPQKMFFKLSEKSNLITFLTIKPRKFTFISPTVFDQNLLVFPKLQELDLLRFHNNINDHSLSKLLNACLKSLKVFRLGYGT